MTVAWAEIKAKKSFKVSNRFCHPPPFVSPFHFAMPWRKIEAIGMKIILKKCQNCDERNLWRWSLKIRVRAENLHYFLLRHNVERFQKFTEPWSSSSL